MQKLISYIDHPTARWFYICSSLGLEMVTLLPLKGAQEHSRQPELAKQHGRALMAMLSGSGVYPLPISIAGTDFQQQVWQQIARIPHGETIDYSELARRVGNEKAVRAVGSACGKNPVPVAIPCHRVLRADGSLGGFAFGLEVKQRMLDYEANCFIKHAA